MRFIHTADWQIGKSFRSFGDREPLLRQARLDAIEVIAKLAAAEQVTHVLVAGDLYDTEAPSRKTLLEPLERMRSLAESPDSISPDSEIQFASCAAVDPLQPLPTPCSRHWAAQRA